MKQLKFLMIVFTLMMGVSFTSCMGESDPTVSPVATLKVVSAYPYTCLLYTSPSPRDS